MEYLIAGAVALIAIVVLGRWRMKVVARQLASQQELAERRDREYRRAHLWSYAERAANGAPTAGTVTADEAELVAAFGPNWRQQFKDREAALMSGATQTRGTGVRI